MKPKSRLLARLIFILVIPFCISSCGKESIVPVPQTNMPHIELTGDFKGISKDNPVDINVTYTDPNSNLNFNMPASIKLQGSSSINYPKKNFTLKLEDKVKIVDNWGKQKKYCIKANWIDFSQMRNVVSAKLYGQIAKTRTDVDDFSNLPNCGAIDGFPILVTQNGEFYGLCTFNIPKDEWMFGMKDGKKYQAIIMGDQWGEVTSLRKTISKDFSAVNEVVDNMQLEYNSKEDEGDYSWITKSFNNMINFLNIVRTPQEMISNSYVNTNRAIDTMLFTQFIYAADNTSKNILWTTFDGTKWAPNVYDLDGTWGLFWNGEIACKPEEWGPDKSMNSNLLWEQLYRFCREQIKERYFELRKNVLTIDNIKETFTKFESLIPDNVKQAEMEKWPTVPSRDTNNLSQILSFAEKRLNYFDKCFDNYR